LATRAAVVSLAGDFFFAGARFAVLVRFAARFAVGARFVEAFFAPVARADDFLAGALRAADFFVADFLVADLAGADFFEADFLAVDFFAEGFFALFFALFFAALRLAPLAVARDTSLLKRFWRAVESRTASLSRSSHSKNSSHPISSSVSSPLKPGKSILRMPGSSPLPVALTRAGLPPRDSAHFRISSWSVVARAVAIGNSFTRFAFLPCTTIAKEYPA
jgi:hypothetical protein